MQHWLAFTGDYLLFRYIWPDDCVASAAANQGWQQSCRWKLQLHLRLGGLVVAYGFIKYAKNYNDIVPIGDYDSYIVTISWDSSFRNFSASQERTILGYTATYRFIWCDAFDDDQFWYLVKYDIQPTYAPLIQ